MSPVTTTIWVYIPASSTGRGIIKRNRLDLKFLVISADEINNLKLL